MTGITLTPVSGSPNVRRMWIGVTAAALVLLVYWRTLWFEFYWDDYHMVRPWTTAEVRHVLTRSWDPTRIEAVFYRPLASLWYAARFQLFGLNGAPQHAVSIAGMIVAAYLAGWFVLRETGRTRPAIIAAAIYALHPAFVYSEGAWLTNQMHLFSSLIVLSALVVWQRVRDRPLAAWWPLALLQIAAFGFKEDTILLTPLLVGLTLLRAWIVGDVRVPGPAIWLSGGALAGGLVFARFFMLGKIGGYGIPSEDRAWFNFKRGLDAIFLMAPGRLVAGYRPWHPAARHVSMFMLALGAASAVVRRRRTIIYLLLCGVAIGVAFDLPFALVTKQSQMHLVTLGAVIALAASAEALIEVVSAPVWRAVSTAGVAAGLATFIPLDAQIVDEFAPCYSETLGLDGQARSWSAVPEEVRAWLVSKRAECDAGRVPVPMSRAIPSVTWTYDSDTTDGESVRWTSGHSVMLIPWDYRELQIALRQPYASSSSPVTVSIHGPFSEPVINTLTSGEWVYRTLPLGPTWRDWLRDSHWIDINVSPTFVPGLRDPANPDNRKHGVEFRVVSVRP